MDMYSTRMINSVIVIAWLMMYLPWLSLRHAHTLINAAAEDAAYTGFRQFINTFVCKDLLECFVRIHRI